MGMNDMTTSTTNHDKLEQLAGEIRGALLACERGKAEWARGALNLCTYLAEARAMFKADRQFGDWLKEQKLALSDDDRAAAIAMGKQPEVARAVLEATERRSLRHIHRTEFKSRFRHVAKPKAKAKPAPEAPDTKPAPKAPDANPDPKERETLERALHAYDRRKLAGEPITRTLICEEANVSRIIAMEAIVRRETEERVRAEYAPQSKPELSKTMQEKFDAMVRAEKKRFQLELETAVQAEVQKRMDEMIFPAWNRKYEELFNTIKHRKGVLTADEYRKLVKCLHPDGLHHLNPSPKLVADFNEAFRIIRHYELALCNEKEKPVDMFQRPPATFAEAKARAAAAKAAERERKMAKG